ARLREIRAVVGPEVGIRLDANGAWSLREAQVALERLGDVDLELVEQPLGVDAPLEDWLELRGVGVRIAADESVRNEQSMSGLLPGIDAVVLKPMFIGGLQAAVAMGRRAQAEGRQVVVTSCLGSGVERYGALHVAAALRGPGLLACGLDTGGLIQDDPCAGPVALGGFMPIGGVGLGLQERLF
ncbi:MAG: enolase C-terminal domain-like protein, partial [Myxococcota bacterium]|nr:enolase C-terminal domain-like protein [Myxococcota bacterium]